jgi:hypothetical protein
MNIGETTTTSRRVESVTPLPDFRLLLIFNNAEQRVFDVNPYLDKGVFAELKDESLFRSVHVCFDTVEWNNGADLCPEVLYAQSEPAGHVVSEKSGCSVAAETKGAKTVPAPTPLPPP